MSSFWPPKNLPSSQPRATVLLPASLGLVRPRPLTLHPAWCFPTHMVLFLLLATWDAHLSLVKPYVNPTIVIFHSSRLSSAVQKKTIQWKVLTAKACRTGWHEPLALFTSNPYSHVPHGRRKLRRSPVLLWGEQAKALPEQVSFSLFLKRQILPK